MNSSVLAVLAVRAVLKGKKMDLSYSEQLFRVIFFSLLSWAAQTVQTEEFMFQNVAYWSTVNKTGIFPVEKSREQRVQQ